MADEYREITNKLEAVSEELADLALAQLHEAIADARSTASPEEKRITKARRAIERAIHFLSEPTEDNTF